MVLNDKITLDDLKENGLLIKGIEDPKEEMKLTTVKQNGISIKYIKTHH